MRSRDVISCLTYDVIRRDDRDARVGGPSRKDGAGRRLGQLCSVDLPAMPRQTAGRGEGLAARRTLARTVAGVSPHMSRKVAGLEEGLAARRALERPLAGVRPQMPRQVGGS